MVRTRFSPAALIFVAALSSGCMGSHHNRCNSCDPCCCERPSLMDRMRSAFRGRGDDCCCDCCPSCCDMCCDGCCEGPCLGDCCGPNCGGPGAPPMAAPPVAAPPIPGPGPLTPQAAVPALTPPPQTRLVPQPQAAPQAFRR